MGLALLGVEALVQTSPACFSICALHVIRQAGTIQP
jgi:hypothetical protein